MMLGPLLDCHHRSPGVWVVCQPLEALRKTTVAKVAAQFFAHADISVTLWTPGFCDDFDVPTESVAVIFCSPEQLGSVFRVLRQCVPLVHGLLVDEVHLRFLWEFRDYTPSDSFSSLFPEAVIGVFSATLSPEMSAEVVRRMGMRRVAFFTEREFPHLRAMKLARWDQFCLRRISVHPERLVSAIVDVFSRLAAHQSIIVFASSYAKLAKLAEPLGRASLREFAPRIYCASFSQTHKDETCAKLKSGDCRLVGATCALGAGVDLPNVGAIIFFGCPKTLSDAAQGMGRAGRGQDHPLVEVLFAVDSNSLSKVDSHMRLLMGYCSELKSKNMVQCSACQARRPRPATGSGDLFSTCFDFEGVHCGRPERPVCKRTMCKVFDGLLPHEALTDVSLDCLQCDACVPPIVALPEGALVRYGTRDAIIIGRTGNLRYQILEVGTGTPHAVAGTSLVLVSAETHEKPLAVEKNKLKKAVRLVLQDVLREQFQSYSMERFCLLSSMPSDRDVHNLSKWTVAECVRRSPIQLPGVDMEQWFTKAQRDAKYRAAVSAVSTVAAGAGAGAGARDGAVANEGAVSDEGAEGRPLFVIAGGGVREFQLPASLNSFLERFARPLSEQVMANKDTGTRAVRSRESATQRTGRGTQSLGGDVALPSKDSSKKRRASSGTF